MVQQVQQVQQVQHGATAMKIGVDAKQQLFCTMLLRMSNSRGITVRNELVTLCTLYYM